MWGRWCRPCIHCHRYVIPNNVRTWTVWDGAWRITAGAFGGIVERIIRRTGLPSARLIGRPTVLRIQKHCVLWPFAFHEEALTSPTSTDPQPTGEPRNPAYLTLARSGAVASESLTCSELGTSILRDSNGTAVDAAITTTLCIGLLNAFSSGIGGGGFMVVRKPSVDGGWKESKGGTITAIDFRETSPKRSDKWMFGDRKAGRMAAQVGGLSVGTPGDLRGLEAGKFVLLLLRGESLGMGRVDWLVDYRWNGRHS